jgi:copper chaperone CopZ
LTSTIYQVTGMTCDHCAGAVTAELQGLASVSGVTVDLVAGGMSAVTVTSTRPLPDAEIAAALDEAGGYRLAGAGLTRA